MRGGAREARRLSSCASAVFVWATSAAHAAFPATPQAERAVREAMRATIPPKLHKVSKKNRQAHKARLKRKRQPLA
jgi:hypothetical protein